jgi:hypothetical protein
MPRATMLQRPFMSMPSRINTARDIVEAAGHQI